MMTTEGVPPASATVYAPRSITFGSKPLGRGSFSF